MNRSRINSLIGDCLVFFDEMMFRLPNWSRWGINDWRSTSCDISEIVSCGLGWDITDFGSGDFDNIGLMNFNLRNGIPGRTRKQYCEKIIVVRENQVTPLHTHRDKVEDIINRGGGNLVIELHRSSDFQTLDLDPVVVNINAMPTRVDAGGKVVLRPGDSIFLEPGVFHLFYGEGGTGQVLVGEVSSVNDDSSDNVFYDDRPRFPQITEDSAPKYLLVNDYSTMLNTEDDGA